MESYGVLLKSVFQTSAGLREAVLRDVTLTGVPASVE